MRRWRQSLGVALAVAMLAGLASAQSKWQVVPAQGGPGQAQLRLDDLDGAAVDLAAFKGEVVLVNFWATWCEPCREEMPALNRLQQQLGGQRFRVIGVNVGEGKPRIAAFVSKNPVSFMIVRDADSQATRDWRVRVLPASFLVDRKGTLRYQLIGAADWDQAAIRAPVLALTKH